MSKIIIIGSGFGGLTCGYILQRNGYDVTILEQGVQIGGCLQCFSRKGAKFETGMHFIGSAKPDQTIGQIMRYFGILDNITLSALDSDGYNTVSLAGDIFRFPNGREPFLERFAGYFPKERDALVKYLNIVDKIAKSSTLNSLTSEQRDTFADTSYHSLSINSVMDSIFKDELLKNALVGDLPLYAAELDKTPFSQHAYIMDFYNNSSFRIEGGSDAIATILATNIRQMGGEILTRKRVAKVCCNDTKAIGVITDDEVFYGADYVISTIHPNRLLEMLETKLIRPAFRSRICNIPQTTSCFAVYLKFKEGAMPYMNTNYYGYATNSPWNCENYTDEEWPKGFLYMHMCEKGTPQYAKSGVLISYMNMADVAQWQGSTIGRRGEEYEEFKRQHALKLIAEVEKHHPGFTTAIECYFTSTPLTYLDYTGTEGGSMYGVVKDVNLGAAGRVPYRTKIPNLLLAGQNVNSHGIMGVIVGTIVTCSELVSAEKMYKQIKELSV
ncbi:MAG: NAD(P)/FAD-dependent oxidoreductase [Alistipes sp.]|nr:NAD(P)/FAD-dependent oxidoreductase [Alistipes sp.]